MSLEEKIKWLEEYYAANGLKAGCKEEEEIQLELNDLFTITPDEWQEYFANRPTCEYTFAEFSINDYWQDGIGYTKSIKNIMAIIPKCLLDYFGGFTTFYLVRSNRDFDVAWDSISQSDSAICKKILNDLIKNGKALKLAEDSFWQKCMFSTGKEKLNCNFEEILPVGVFTLNTKNEVKWEIKPDFIRDIVMDIVREKLASKCKRTRRDDKKC